MKKIGEATQPQSVCFCGHSGDGPGSSHGGIIGHGPCTIQGCGCERFTWKAFLRYGRDRALRMANARRKLNGGA